MCACCRRTSEGQRGSSQQHRDGLSRKQEHTHTHTFLSPANLAKTAVFWSPLLTRGCNCTTAQQGDDELGFF